MKRFRKLVVPMLIVLACVLILLVPVLKGQGNAKSRAAQKGNPEQVVSNLAKKVLHAKTPSQRRDACIELRMKMALDSVLFYPAKLDREQRKKNLPTVDEICRVADPLKEI